MYIPTMDTRSANDLFDNAYAFFFSDFLYKSICCKFSFELHLQFDAIQIGTHNICLYKETDKMYTGCYLKTMKSLDCALIGYCAVIRLNMEYNFLFNHENIPYLPRKLGHHNFLTYLS